MKIQLGISISSAAAAAAARERTDNCKRIGGDRHVGCISRVSWNSEGTSSHILFLSMRRVVKSRIRSAVSYLSSSFPFFTLDLKLYRYTENVS